MPVECGGALVGEILCSGEGDAWGDDALDGGVIRQVQEQHRLVHGAVLLEVLPPHRRDSRERHERFQMNDSP